MQTSIEQEMSLRTICSHPYTQQDCTYNPMGSDGAGAPTQDLPLKSN